MAIRFLFVALAFMPAAVLGTEQHMKYSANPVRKVVTMLQMMIKKIEVEGEKEKELFDKFMCYCDNADATLGKSISDAETKIPQLESTLKGAVEMKAQLESDIQSHQADREAAKAAMAMATAIREKEAAAFAKESAEDMANLDALKKATVAIEKGMAGGFLQTNAAAVLLKLVVSKPDILDIDREQLVSFLSGTEGDGYAPASGEIVGILKQLGDEMFKDLQEMIAAEEAAIKAYEELMAAKKEEIEALTKAIEEKLVRVSELGVEIATMKNDLEDTSEGLAEDKKFLADLAKNCELKKKEWEIRCKTRSEELLALADTIKILNDDDALELFKKTLPSASAFLQTAVSAKEVRKQALQALAKKQGQKRDSRLEFISLALRGGAKDFTKVIAMIDEMVALLGKEQTADDDKKAYCLKELDTAEDDAKVLEQTIADLEKAIAEANDMIATLKDEIEALEDGIKALDKAVVEATETRKSEHTTYVDTMAADNAAKELIGVAKNRLAKFYTPKLYKAAPKRELSAEERVSVNMGGTMAPTAPPGGISGTGITYLQSAPVLAQVSAHQATKDVAAPPPPPETWSAYATKGEEHTGVVEMLNMLVADLDKEIQSMTVDENDAQAEYEKLMADSGAKR